MDATLDSGGGAVALGRSPARDDYAGAARHLGDVLLTFGDPLDRVPARGESIETDVLAARRGWRFDATAPSAAWRGVPIRAIATSTGPCWVIGELYGTASASGAKRLVRNVVAGSEPASRLNGHFVVMWYDERRRTWHVVTDRFGTLHVYHASLNGRAALGTYFPAVAATASRRELDWTGVACFFAQGFFPGDATYYTDVRILEPATHTELDDAGRIVASTRTWDWSHTPEANRSYGETVDSFADVWTRVMDEHLGGRPVAVPLSGGLDSRSTVAPARALAAGTAAERAWGYSYGYSPDSRETAIAAEVARRRGLPFDAFVVGPYLMDRCDAVLDAVEGFEDLTQCRQAAVVDEIASRADSVIAAHWGDVWMDDMGLANRDDPSPAADVVAEHAARKVLKRGRDWLLSNVCAPHVPSGTSADWLVRDEVAARLARLDVIACPDFRVKAFKTDFWSFRWTTTSLRMFQPAAFPRLPFYDTRVADLFCTVPTEFVRGRRLQIDYLKRFAPDLARVAWQPYETSLFAYRYARVLRAPRRALARLRRAGGGRRSVERNWEVQFAGEHGRALFDRHLLRSGLTLHDLVARPAVAGLLDALAAAPTDPSLGYSVSMLLTFSAWLERHHA